MSRDQLLGELAAIKLAEGEVAYVARRGDEYTWALEGPQNQTADDGGLPDAWIYYCGPWPSTDEARAPFLDELLAEMESMTANDDRCRWPLDDPWPRAHLRQPITDDEPRDDMHSFSASPMLTARFTSLPPSEGDDPR